MPNNPSTGGEVALWDSQQQASLLVADAPGSGATGTLRLWGTGLGLAVDASASVSGAGLATEATLLKTVGLGLPEWDYVSMNTPSLPTVITFKIGGSGGTTVATLTITYSGTDIATVTRT